MPILLETIKIKDGKVYHLNYHQQRLDASLAHLGLTDNICLASLITPPQEGLWRCRVTYGGGDVNVSYHPYQIKSFHSIQAVIDEELHYTLKYESREKIDMLRAQCAHADDILIIQKGCVTDTSIANIAFFDGAQWLTPEKPLLQGTTRARLLDENKIVTATIPLHTIHNYEKIALMNAMLGFIELENGILLPK